MGRLKEVAQKAERGLRVDLEARTKEGKRLQGRNKELEIMNAKLGKEMK